MTREEAIMILKNKMDGSVDTSYEWVETVRMAIDALSDRPKGKWGNTPFGGLRTCSNCGYICIPILEYQTQDIYNFCPNCGAKMDKEEEDDK